MKDKDKDRERERERESKRERKRKRGRERERIAYPIIMDNSCWKVLVSAFSTGSSLTLHFSLQYSAKRCPTLINSQLQRHALH